MAARLRNGRSMGTVDAGHFAKQFPIVFIDDHHARLACDEQPVVGGIRDDVIPKSVAADRERVRDAIHGLLRPSRQHDRH